jgi:hypothetical protein
LINVSPWFTVISSSAIVSRLFIGEKDKKKTVCFYLHWLALCRTIPVVLHDRTTRDLCNDVIEFVKFIGGKFKTSTLHLEVVCALGQVI